MSKALDSIAHKVRKIRMLGHNPDQESAVDQLVSAISDYCAEVAKEIEGLNGDVKSAESAYEREKVRADNLSDENDRWKNESLPGWRKRVADTKGRLRDMELSRDDWKRRHNVLNEALASTETNLENVAGQVTFLKQWVQDLQAEQKIEISGPNLDVDFDAMLRHIVNPGEDLTKDIPWAGIDPAAPEGDKTVLVWTCCNVTHTYTPPKGYAWEHEADCHECGSKTIIRA